MYCCSIITQVSKRITQTLKTISTLSILFLLTGCSSTWDAEQHKQSSSQLEPIKANLARLVLVRPREALFSFNDKNPLQIYVGSQKIAEIPHGHYITLESPQLPTEFTIHWFDNKHPKISRSINLNVHLTPGNSQTVQLKMNKNNLLANLLNEQEEARSLLWAQKYELPSNLAEALAHRDY